MVNAASPLLDLSSIVDPSRCPVCAASLRTSRCHVCGADLSGETAGRVWALSQRIVALAAERDGAVAALRRTARPAPAVPAPAVPAPAVAGTQPHEMPPPQVAPAAPRPRAAVPLQALLVGLGALLLAVAAIVFLVRQWDALGLGPRALVIAALTTATLAAAARLHSRLPSTAEALGALGAVLLLGDAWAVRHTGLLNADAVPPLRYWSVALAAVALVLLAARRLGRLRSWSLGAVAIGPLAPALLGADLAAHTGHITWHAAGMLAVAGVSGLAMRVGHGRGRSSAAAGLPFLERLGLAAWACVGLCASLLVEVVLLDADRPAAAAVSMLATAAVAGALAVATPRVVDELVTSAWAFTGGLCLAGSAACVAVWIVQANRWDGVWVVPLLALGTGTAMALTSFARALPIYRPAGAGAGAGFAAAAVPTVTLAAGHSVLVLAAATPAWRGRPDTPLGSLAQPAGAAGLGDLAAGSWWLPAVLGLLVAVAGCLLAPLARASRVLLASCALACLATLLPLHPALAVWAVTTLLAAVAVGAAALSVLRPATGAPALACAAATGALAAVLSWSAQPLTSPVMALAAAGLALAGRRAVSDTARVLLAVAATVSFVLAAWAVPLTGLEAQRHVAAAVAGAVLAGVAVGLPRRSWTTLGRLAVAVPAASALAIGIVLEAETAVAGQPDRPLELLLSLGLVVAGMTAVRRPTAVLEVAASAAIPGLATLVAVVLTWELPASDLLSAPVVAALVAAVCALAVAVLVEGAGAGLGARRRVAAEAGTGAVAFGALAAALAPVAAGTGGDDTLWLLMLVLGVGAAGLAIAPDRRPLGWLSGVLLTGSAWAWLALADVEIVEAYTIPPAAALLAVAALRLRRRGSRQGTSGPLTVLVPGLALATVPSVLASASGTPIRPVAVLAACAAAVAACVLLAPRLPAGLPVGIERALLGTAGIAAAGTGIVRGAVAPVGEVELWTLPAAAVLLAAGWAARRQVSPPEAALVPGLLLAALPSLLVASEDRPALRAGVVLACSGVLSVVAGSGRVRVLRRVTCLVSLGVAVTAAAVGLAASRWPVLGGDRVVEAWTVPLAAVLLALGALRLREVPGSSSWQALGIGLGVLLVPSLVLTLGEGPTWRAVALLAAATSVVIVGAVRRLQAPVVLGSAVLTVHVVHLAGPSVFGFVAAAPRWVALAVAGAALLALGARFEQRLADVRAARTHLASLR